MQQVAEWLEKLGLGQYAPRFAENDISFSVLSDLTDQDLKDIGVSLGHRRQLLRAIAELTSGEKEAPKPAGPTVAAQQTQQALGTNGQINTSTLPNTGVICQEETVATFCNVATGPNNAGYRTHSRALSRHPLLKRDFTRLCD
jgi:hypothetical protein